MAKRSIFELDYLLLLQKQTDFILYLVTLFPNTFNDYSLVPTLARFPIEKLLPEWVNDNPEEVKHSTLVTTDQLLDDISSLRSMGEPDRGKKLAQISTQYLECLIRPSNPNYPVCFFFYLCAISGQLRQEYITYHFKEHFNSDMVTFRAFLEDGAENFLIGHNPQVQLFVFDPIIFAIKIWLSDEPDKKVTPKARLSKDQINNFFILLNHSDNRIDLNLINDFTQLVNSRGKYKSITFYNKQKKKYDPLWVLYAIINFLHDKDLIDYYNNNIDTDDYIVENFKMIKEGKEAPIPIISLQNSKNFAIEHGLYAKEVQKRESHKYFDYSEALRNIFVSL